MTKTSLSDLQKLLLEKGVDVLIPFASDPDASDENLVFCFFFLPKTVEQNPAWILTKMSTDIGKIAQKIFNHNDYDKFAKFVPTDKESLYLISDIGGVTQQILLVFGRQNSKLDIALDDILPEEGVAFDNRKVDPMHTRLIRWDRSADSPHFKKMIGDHKLSFDRLFGSYLAFPEAAKQNPGWNLLKNMPPKEIADIIVKNQSEFSAVSQSRPFQHIQDWLEYANFLLPVADAVEFHPDSEGSDFDISPPVFYRLRASRTQNPEEFSKEKILNGLTVSKRNKRHIESMLNDKLGMN